MSTAIATVRELSAVATERLEAAVQTTAALIAATTCEWLLMIAELDRREAWASWECRSMANWLSWKCALSARAGREHVRVARELERLPRVRAEFAAGRLSYSKVRALTRIVTAPELEDDLVEVALVATATQLDSIASGCARARRADDPEHEQRIHDERRWSLVIDENGVGTLTMRGPADQLAEVMASVDAVVRHEPRREGDDLAARRFDAAITVARRHFAPEGDSPPVATLVVRVDAPTPAGATIDLDAATAPKAHGLPISRAAYERFRCDAAVAVERLLDDGSVARSRTTEAIPRAVRRAVRARDLGCCRWPGCGARGSIHVHHVVWRSRFGPNAIENLVSLCHYHHRAVHQRGWRIEGNANGELVFTAPNGRIARDRSELCDPVPAGALATHHASRGYTPDASTIATAYRDRLDRAWAVGTICHNEEVLNRRN